MDKDKEIARLTNIAIAKAERCDEYYALLLKVYEAFGGMYYANKCSQEQDMVMRDVAIMLTKIQEESHEHNRN